MVCGGAGGEHRRRHSKAIAALERVLLNDPNLPNIKLELGLLYLRVGQADLAQAYLRAAVDAPGAPESARIRARQALRSAGTSAGRLGVAGTLRFGAQYQTNPNGSPDTVSVIGPANVAILITGDQLDIPRGSDASVYGSAAVELRYDLGTQRGNDIVANFTVAATRFADQTVINSTYLGAQLGPRFFLGPDVAPEGFIQPYVSAAHLVLGGSDYFSAVGGGFSAFRRLSLAISVAAAGGYNHRDYNNSRTRPVADEQTGGYYTGGLTVLWQAGPRTRLSLGMNAEHAAAKRGYWSRDTYGPAAGVTRLFAVGKGAPWVGTFSASYQHARYDDPDPLVDPNRRRRDDRTEIGTGIEIPLPRSLALEIRVEQSWNESNIPNYDYKNSLGSIGINYRF